jgi:glycine cleavage system H protein
MTEFLKTMVDKFTFKVATDRLYTVDHLWLKESAGLVRLGLSDYLQQSSGDVAFAEPKAEGTNLAAGDEVAVIETMKTSLDIFSPVSGVITAINPRLADEPELVNIDPYGEGWLVELEPRAWDTAKIDLLAAEVYFEQMKAEAESEAKKV